MPQDDVAGYVLAGGRSQRMGRDKATLLFRAETLIERAVALLAQVASEVAIVGNRPDLSGFGRVIPDAAADFGPVAGLTAGTKDCRKEWAVFVPVDVPFLASATLLRLLDEARNSNAMCAVPLIESGPEPLCAVLHRTMADGLEHAVAAGEHKVMRALEAAAGDRLILVPGFSAEEFVNLNTAKDHAEYDGVDEF